MKPNSLSFATVIAMLLSATVLFNTKAQTISVDTIKNTPDGEGFNDLLFQVGDSTILKVASDGNIEISTNLDVPNGFLRVDSIRARVIHAGDSSILIGGFPCTGCGFTNSITTTTGSGTLGISPDNGETIFSRNSTGTDVRIGIGRPPSDPLDIGIDYTNTAIDRSGIAINGIAVLHNWGQFNFFAGEDAGSSNNSAIPSGGSQNAFVGYRSGYRNSTGGCNVFMGSGAGGNNTTGNNNTFIGNVAGSGNVSDSDNVCVGSEAGLFTVQGSENTFLGRAAGKYWPSSGQNTLVGYSSGYGSAFPSGGSGNCFFGANTGRNNSSGDRNVFIGTGSGFFNSTGDNNIFIGFGSGNAI